MRDLSIKNSFLVAVVVLATMLLSVTLSAKEVVIVDKGVSDYQFFVDNVKKGTDVIFLESDKDGLSQITSALKKYKNLDAIHIISHGDSGKLLLGSSHVSSDTLKTNSADFKKIGASLSSNGDLLLYGCNVAKDEKGKSFIDALAEITDADILASSDNTGAITLNANWELEFAHGKIQSSTLHANNLTVFENYKYTLSTFTIKNTVTADGSSVQNGDTFTFANFSYAAPDVYVSASTIATITFTSNNVDMSNILIYRFPAVNEKCTITPYPGGIAGTPIVVDSQVLLSNDVSANNDFKNMTKITIHDEGGAVQGCANVNFETITYTNASAGPTITSATYNALTGSLVVTGTDFAATGGATNDVIANKMTLTGEGGETYTLTDSANVEIASATGFTLALSATDKAALNMMMNKNGTTSTSNTTYDIDGAAGFIAASAAVADTGVNGVDVSDVAVPTITSSTYNASTGVLVVTGTGFLKKSGGTNDIVANKFTFTGAGTTYTLTNTTNVEITTGTAFTMTLSATDKAAVNTIINKNGTASTNTVAYNLNAAEDWAAGADAAVNVVDATGNGITASNVAVPTITSSTYNAATGALVVTGTGFLKKSGGTNDIDVTKFTFTGAGSTYQLTANTSNVEITSGTTFTVTLGATDKAALNQIINKNGTASTDTVAYNLNAAEDWAAGADTATTTTVDATGNAITASSVAVPAITSSTYDASTGTLVVTGTGYLKKSGAVNDIVANKFTFTGAGATYTLTNTTNVEITTGTVFTMTLSAADKAALNTIINKDGTASTNTVAYNLNAAEDWAAGADAAINVVDATGNGITVSNVAVPSITDATYDYNTNILSVTGTGFLIKSGATNDIDISMLTFTGESGATYTLTSATDVEITSGTSFLLTLSGADITNVEALLNKNGATSATAGTTYNLAAAEDWAKGADAAVNVVDATGNGITVSNYAIPALVSATYDVATGQLVLSGTNFVNKANVTNDVDSSMLTLTGEGGTYTLTDSADVEITSATSATVTISTADKLNINGILNKNGISSSGATTYNVAAAEDWMTGSPTAIDIADLTGNGINVSNVATPTITDATYDSDTGIVVVTGSNLFKKIGANNDVDISMLTFTGGIGNSTYTLTSASDVEITSATSFSLTLSGSDKTQVDSRLDQIGTSSSGGSTYNLAGADNWLTGADAAANIADATNAITVSINPKITSATYNAATGSLVVTGTNFQAKTGVTNDITANKFTLTGEGGATHTLTDTANVERISATIFNLTLSANDKAALNQIMNKDGVSSTGTTTYNLAAADDWCANVTAGDTSDTTLNGVTVSNVAAPAITASTYNANTGSLVITGTNLTKFTGATNDIDVSMLTFTGEGGVTYTLTDTTNVEITSGTAATITLSAADKEQVNRILNKNGSLSTSNTTYNLAAAEDWAKGADAAVNVADTTGNGITVSNVAVPSITSSTYNATSGALVVTGSSFLSKTGATNDIVANKFTFTGEGGATYTLTDSADVEITSSTAFTVTLSSTDKSAVARILNKNGTTATAGTTYNLNAAEDWAAGADAAVSVVDATGNAITVSNVPVPTITSATYNYATAALAVTGTGFTMASGGSNDIDLSKLSITGDGGVTYTLTTATDVEITSDTEFSVTLSGADILSVNGLLNKNATLSDGGTTYNLSAAEDWARGAATAVTIADTTAGITVSNYTVPVLTSATYDANTNQLVVSGTNFVSKSGAANDIDISMLTLTGEAGATYTLTSATDVEIASATSFTLTLSGNDMLNVESLLNKNGTASDGATTYNLAAADNWMLAAATSADISDATGNGVTVSNVVAPAITSATYDVATFTLVVTGTNFVSKAGGANDIDISTLTFTGDAGATYALTSAADVEVTSATEFSVVLSSTDRLAVNGLLNKNGTTSDGGTTYNLAGADNWLRGAASSVNIADAAGNGITVSNYANPTIAYATFDTSTGALAVIGTGFVSKSGATNDIDMSMLTFTGQAGATYTLTTAVDVDVNSTTGFTATLSGSDLNSTKLLLNEDGNVSMDATTYNIAGADNWMVAAATSVNIADATGNKISVSGTQSPVIDLDGDDSSGGTNGGYKGEFTTGGSAVKTADDDSSIVDDGTFRFLAINLSNRLDGALESLSSSFGSGAQSVNSEAVTISAYNSSTGDMNITVDDNSTSAATMTMLIESILYNNTSTLPNTTDRSIKFKATDEIGHVGSEVTALIGFTTATTESNDPDKDGYTVAQGDCNNYNFNINPGATDIPNNGTDEDCSGADKVDMSIIDSDKDGFTPAVGDCNDADALINPDATEIVNNGIDEDCSGSDLIDMSIIDSDGDGFTPAAGDCNDGDALINPSAIDIADNGIDEDCSGDDTVVDSDKDSEPGTVTHEVAVTNSNGEVVVTKATSEIKDSETTVDEDGKVETKVTITNDNSNKNVTLSVIANPDGTASHTVSVNGVDTKTTSKIVGATTTIKKNGSIVTEATQANPQTIDGEEYIVSAVVETLSNGKTKTKFVKVNVVTGERTELKQTLKEGNSFHEGNTVTIEEKDGHLVITVKAKVTTVLTF